jgi:hypothetical protein
MGGEPPLLPVASQRGCERCPHRGPLIFHTSAALWDSGFTGRLRDGTVIATPYSQICMSCERHASQVCVTPPVSAEIVFSPRPGEVGLSLWEVPRLFS